MAIMLPGDAHAAVHVRVRRRDRPVRRLRRLRRARASSCCARASAPPPPPCTSPATCRPASSTASARCRCAASAVLTGHVVASLRAQPARDRRRDRRRAARRIPPDGGRVGLARRDRDHRALHPRRSPTCSPRSAWPRSSPEARERLRVHHPVPPLPLERVRAGRDDAVLAAVDRREPAGHADHRDDPGLLLGTAARTRGRGWAIGWCARHPRSSSFAWGAWLFRRKAGRAAERRAGQRPGSFLSALATACLADAAARPTTSAAWAAESGSVDRPASRRHPSRRPRNGIEPVVDLVQRRGRQAVVAVLALFAHRDELRLAQHLEVLRHRRLARRRARARCATRSFRARRRTSDRAEARRMSRRVPSAITSKMSAMCSD